MLNSPTFLPPDPRVEEPYRLTPRAATRIAILGIVAIVVFGVVFFRLWALQVISGRSYLADANSNQVRTYAIEAKRGPIFDRNGKTLVSNVPGTIVQLWPSDIPEERLPEVIRRLSVLLDVPAGEIRAAIQRNKNDVLTPITLKTAVHDPKVEYLYEHLTEFPGVQVGTVYLRHFDQGNLAAHILGYVGQISGEELAARDSSIYRASDRIGKTGVERTYDTFLRGEPGLGEVRVDNLGRIRSDRAVSEAPRDGNAVRLTIDAELQLAAENALRFGVAGAQQEGEWAANGGAIVALDPRNGEIRAMASYPTFDPSIYVGRIDPKKLRRIGSNAENVPIVNRATAGLYPPGSTFKPVTALAALSEPSPSGKGALLSSNELVPCTADMRIDGQWFKNWDLTVNEAMLLPRALAASCDTYFYNVGLRFYNLPAERGNPLQFWARRMGIGMVTGLDVGPEGGGLLPTPAWRREYFESEVDKLWKSGDSVQLSIGQGELLVTPVQMARFYAMIANGGKLVDPHVVMQVEQPRGKDEPPAVLRSFAAPPPRDLGIDPEALKAVQQGLYDATHLWYGTSYGVFSSFPVPIAGKTGTAEKYVQLPKGYLDLEKPWSGLRDQAWWCGYGPTTKPELTVCVVIENGGHGGSTAAPVALEVFEAYFRTTARSSAIGNANGMTD